MSGLDIHEVEDFADKRYLLSFPGVDFHNRKW